MWKKCDSENFMKDLRGFIEKYFDAEAIGSSPTCDSELRNRIASIGLIDIKYKLADSLAMIDDDIKKTESLLRGIRSKIECAHREFNELESAIEDLKSEIK